MKETKEQIVEQILENAEHLPWKIVSAMYGKLPAVFMRARSINYEQAMKITHSIVQSMGTITDEMEINQIKNMLLTRIDLDH